MKLIILTMRDSKASMYIQPFATIAIASTIRDLTDIINNGQEKTLPWMKYPGDFDLYRIGEFEDATGKIEPQEPDFLLNLGSLKNI